MLTQLNLQHNPQGFTVTVGTTHRTHAGALAHFTELLARFTAEHRQADQQAQTRREAAAGRPAPPADEAPAYGWEGPEHHARPLPGHEPPRPAPLAGTAEADERAAAAETAALEGGAAAALSLFRPATRSRPWPPAEEPPF